MKKAMDELENLAAAESAEKVWGQETQAGCFATAGRATEVVPAV